MPYFFSSPRTRTTLRSRSVAKHTVDGVPVDVSLVPCDTLARILLHPFSVNSSSKYLTKSSLLIIILFSIKDIHGSQDVVGRTVHTLTNRMPAMKPGKIFTISMVEL
jgi:hypothetical protein